MALVPAKCTQCGGTIEVDNTKEAGICKHCGTAFITEKAINNYTTNYNITNNITKVINGKAEDDADVEFNRGLVYLKTKEYTEAEECFHKAIKKSPDVAKNYFYWCFANSKNFENPEVFVGQVGSSFLINKGYIHSIALFFTFAKKEECESLTKEFGINLNNGYEGLVESIFKKYQNKLFKTHLFKQTWLNVVEEINKESNAYQVVVETGKEYIKQVAIELYPEILKKNTCNFIVPQKLESVNEIINYLISHNLFPNYSGGAVFGIEMFDLAARLDEEFYASCTELKKSSKREQLEKEKYQAFKQFKDKFIAYAAWTIIGLIVGSFIILYFKNAYTIYNSPDYVKGVTDIFKTPFKPAALMSLLIGVCSSVLSVLIYFILKRKYK